MAGSKWASDTLLDLLLQYLEDNIDWISVCTEGCTTYEHAHSNVGTGTGKVLAHSVTPTFTGPADDISGRKTTVDEEANMDIDVSGTPAEVCLVDTGNTALLYKTTCSVEGGTITAGGTVTAPAWKINIPDPV